MTRRHPIGRAACRVPSATGGAGRGALEGLARQSDAARLVGILQEHGRHRGDGTTVSTRSMYSKNDTMKPRRNASVDSSVTTPSSSISPGRSWM